MSWPASIVTFNVKDFHPESLEPWGVSAFHPSDYLKVIFEHDPAIVINALHGMAEQARRTLPEILGRLAWYAKPFSLRVGSALAIEIPDIPPIEWRR